MLCDTYHSGENTENVNIHSENNSTLIKDETLLYKDYTFAGEYCIIKVRGILILKKCRF